MPESSPTTYEFGPFRCLPSERRLLREGQPVRLAPKVFDTLLYLVENPGRLIEKDEFLNRVWPDTFVEEVTLAHSISELRKHLGSGQGPYIETVAKRGYRFTAQVKVNRQAPELQTPHWVLAVLPFENLSAEADREYVADGLTEELIAVLGQIDPEHLSVIGRTSVMAYQGAKKSLSEIGRELGATLLVESSLRGEAGRMRITSKLVRAADQVQIWSGSYDREPNSMLTLQRDMSATIAEQIHLRLSPERLDALKRRQAHSPEAYDSYLRGRYFWNHFTPPTTRRAIECFARSTELDPDYALAWAGLADAYASGPIHADVRPKDVWEKAREAAQRAVGIEPNLAETQSSLGMVKFWLDWEWTEAEGAFRSAIALDPSYSLAHRMLGIVLAHMGRNEEETRLTMQRARALDPLQAMHHALSAQVAFVLRDFAGALEFGRQATVVFPGSWIGYYQLAQAHEQRGEYECALEALAKAANFANNSKILSLRGYVLGKMGRQDDARSALTTLQGLSQERYVPPYAAALVYASLGDRDSAYRGLEMGFEVHDVHLALLPADPKWDGFRADARFGDLLRRCGLPHERLG
ncbi:MAG TPA: winged helix-turn-helix domain-containing protein [Terriglobales bacterium]|nr:winged helix-turn-helix domain-containing protein [Terriglobales bacterium]